MNTESYDRVDRYIDGELTGEELRALRSEAESDPRLAALLNDADEYKELMRGLDDGITVPLDVQASWRRTVCEEAKKKKRGFGRTAIRVISAAAAALVLLAGATGVMRKAGILTKTAPVPESMKASGRYVNVGSDALMSEAAMPEEPVTALENDGEENMMPVMALKEDAVYAAADEAAFVYEEAAEVFEAEEAMPMESPYATIDPEDEAVVLVRSAEYEADSVDTDADLTLISELIDENDGYAETTDRQIVSGGTVTVITARIPNENLDAFLKQLEGVGTMTRVREYSRNIKENYYDAKARLEAMEAEHERLIALMETADEQSLASLGEQLEQNAARQDALRGDIAGWDTDIACAAVTITLTEGAPAPAATPEADLGDRVSNGFSSSWDSVKDFLKDMVVALSVILPVVLVILPAAAVVIIVIVIAKKRKEKK